MRLSDFHTTRFSPTPGARLSRDQAVAIARQAAAEDKIAVGKHQRPLTDFMSGQWHILWPNRANTEYFEVVVDDKSGKTISTKKAPLLHPPRSVSMTKVAANNAAQVPTALQKCEAVKVGMTRSEVYSILPERHFPAGAETEEWQLSSVSAKRPPVVTLVFIDVTFGADGRVRLVGHDSETFPLVTR